jgi:hypothetical protein
MSTNADGPCGSALSEGLGPNAQAVERDPHRGGGSSYEASMLLNLLARIHRDGGHYVETHGLDKALEEAEARVVRWIAAVEGAENPAEPAPAAWIEHHKAGDNLLWGCPGSGRRMTALYAEQDVNVLKVRAFALESASGHLAALVNELDEMVGWAYSQLHRVNYSKQEDALMLDIMKLRLLTRPLGA